MLFCETRNRSFKMHYKVLFIVILPHYSLSQRNGFTLDTCSYNDPIHVCLLQYVLWRQCTLVWKHDKDIYAHSLSIDFEVAVEHTHAQTDSTDTLASHVFLLIMKIASSQPRRRLHPSLSSSPRLLDSVKVYKRERCIVCHEISPYRSTYTLQSLCQTEKHAGSLLIFNIKWLLQSG